MPALKKRQNPVFYFFGADMTTARDGLRTTSIFRFRTLTNNLNFLVQSKRV
jgi:hypothetical protein